MVKYLQLEPYGNRGESLMRPFNILCIHDRTMDKFRKVEGLTHEPVPAETIDKFWVIWDMLKGDWA